MSRTVAVVFGGVSCENEISVITGTMAANVLKGGGDIVVPVYISREGKLYTGEKLADINVFKEGEIDGFPRAIIADGGVYALNKRGKIKKFIKLDCALNCCHGGLGEGGGISGTFACAGIPFAGAGIFESAAFLDKSLTKIVLCGLGVKRLPYAYARTIEDLPRLARLGFPLMIKPATLGSSIGVSIAEGEEELFAAAQTAFSLDGTIIAEPYVAERREINCAAYFADGAVHVSDCEEVFYSGGILSYEDKYQGGGKRDYPAHITERTAQEIKRVTEKVFTRLNMRGISRFDFIVSGDDIYLSEVNTVPGSLSYYLFSPTFKNFYPVLSAILTQAVNDYSALAKKLIIKTGILKSLPARSGKAAVKE